jgi:hypothetical protein
VPGVMWAVAGGAVLALVLALTVAGWRARRDLRAALLATASGAGYGLTGVLFSVAGTAVRDGGLAALPGTWQAWLSLATGLGSFYLLQNALAAGRLVAVEPGITLTNPLVAVTWGVVVFDEVVAGGLGLLGAAAGGALLVAGVLVLARSPVLESHEGRPGEDGGGNDREEDGRSGERRSTATSRGEP